MVFLIILCNDHSQSWQQLMYFCESGKNGITQKLFLLTEIHKNAGNCAVRVCKALQNSHNLQAFIRSMTKEERGELRILIEEKISTLEENIAELEELTKPIAPENAIGRVSRMDAINNRSVNEAALRQSRNKLRGLQNALKNIEKPDFGKCVRCRNQIPPGRLLLVPESGRCVHCY